VRAHTALAAGHGHGITVVEPARSDELGGSRKRVWPAVADRERAVDARNVIDDLEVSCSVGHDSFVQKEFMQTFAESVPFGA